VAFNSGSIYEKEKTTKWRIVIKYFNIFTSAATKRCGECKNPLTDQKLGVDGAMCDMCVEIFAPWMNTPVDPYLLALWTIDSDVWTHQ
jgi:hypothetical protein